MNDSLTKQHLTKVLGQNLFQKRLLVWDSFRCHISQATKAVLKSLKIDTAVVPGGCTPFVQPADVSWNRPFKLRIQEYHDEWLATDEPTKTAGGKFRPPPAEVYLQWIIDAWESIEKTTIIESFHCCGISLNVDGSEDDKIHVFKEAGQCPEGKALLNSAMQELEAAEALQPEEEPKPNSEDDSAASELDSSEEELIVGD